jgi:ATP-dependent RNA helicase RhlE
VSPEEEKYLKEIEKLIKTEIEKEKAVVPHASQHSARSPRAPRAEHAERAPRGEHAERSHARPAAPKKAHDAWFDKPYEPSSEPIPARQPEQAAHKPKKPVAAIFQRKQG